MSVCLITGLWLPKCSRKPRLHEGSQYMQRGSGLCFKKRLDCKNGFSVAKINCLCQQLFARFKSITYTRPAVTQHLQASAYSNAGIPGSHTIKRNEMGFWDDCPALQGVGYMTQQGIDEDRHYSVLFGGGSNSLRIRVVCGSRADVSVSQVLGVFVREL